MGCKTNGDVIESMAKRIIPLLREYFYGNDGMVLLVLGDAPARQDNIHDITEATTAFEKLFNVPREAAQQLGYRAHEIAVGINLSRKFWNPGRLPPGPDDEAYAVRAIMKVYGGGSGGTVPLAVVASGS